jgi:ubiquinone/menaquinone biosynthesis C-methylase UbiE
MSEAHPIPGGKILAFGFGFAPGQILSSALELGIFKAVHEGHQSPEAVARAISVPERGVRVLLDALAGLELLEKVEGHFRLTRLSETYLIPSSPLYLGDAIGHHKDIREAWVHLTEVVKTGKPWRDPEMLKHGLERLGRLARGLYSQNYQRARVLARALGMGQKIKGAKILDVGAGSGAWSIALLEQDPESQAVAVDLAPVIEITREYVEKHGLGDRIQYMAGNIRELDFNNEEYDLAVLGNICHSEGPTRSRSLILKIGRCVKPGGKIIIVDMIPNDERTGPVTALIFAVNMLVATEEGGTFTRREYQEWLREAGFGEIEEIAAGGDSPVLVAERLIQIGRLD